MPVITFNRLDFCKLVGRDLTIEQLERQLPALGVGWEGADGDEISVEITPNRPDMLCPEGLARAFAAFIGLDTGLPEYIAFESGYRVDVNRAVTEIRPYIACAAIKGLKLTDQLIRSLLQLQEKLHISHCRRRAKAAIGVYDLDKISFPLRYTTADPSFRFTPLGFKLPASLKSILERHPKGQEHGWIIKDFKSYPLLVDSRDTVLSMPPIVNGRETAITGKTRNMFIDVTGTDSKTVSEVLNIVACALADRGGKVYAVTVKYPDRSALTPDFSPKVMAVDLAYLNRLLGIELTAAEVIKLLRKMRFDAIEFVDAKVAMIEVTAPAYRTDLMHKIDLVEDVAIARGYQSFEPALPAIATVSEESAIESFSHKLRDLMTGLGMQETLTYILSNRDKLFARMAVPDQPVACTVNPRTIEFTALRTWLLPSLLEALAANRHNPFPQKLFEVGDCVLLDPATDTGTREERKLAAVISHDSANLTEARSVVEALLKNLGLRYEIRPYSHPSFIETRVGKIIVNKKLAGFFGEIHPVVLGRFGLEKPVIALELDVRMLT
jgi:phenylalanyl-tRNA synthetase beta chain